MHLQSKLAVKNNRFAATGCFTMNRIPAMSVSSSDSTSSSSDSGNSSDSSQSSIDGRSGLYSKQMVSKTSRTLPSVNSTIHRTTGGRINSSSSDSVSESDSDSSSSSDSDSGSDSETPNLKTNNASTNFFSSRGGVPKAEATPVNSQEKLVPVHDPRKAEAGTSLSFEANYSSALLHRPAAIFAQSKLTSKSSSSSSESGNSSSSESGNSSDSDSGSDSETPNLKTNNASTNFFSSRGGVPKAEATPVNSQEKLVPVHDPRKAEAGTSLSFEANYSSALLHRPAAIFAQSKLNSKSSNSSSSSSESDASPSNLKTAPATEKAQTSSLDQPKADNSGNGSNSASESGDSDSDSSGSKGEKEALTSNTETSSKILGSKTATKNEVHSSSNDSDCNRDSEVDAVKKIDEENIETASGLLTLSSSTTVPTVTRALRLQQRNKKRNEPLPPARSYRKLRRDEPTASTEPTKPENALSFTDEDVLRVKENIKASCCAFCAQQKLSRQYCKSQKHKKMRIKVQRIREVLGNFGHTRCPACVKKKVAFICCRFVFHHDDPSNKWKCPRRRKNRRWGRAEKAYPSNLKDRNGKKRKWETYNRDKLKYTKKLKTRNNENN